MWRIKSYLKSEKLIDYGMTNDSNNFVTKFAIPVEKIGFDWYYYIDLYDINEKS